jgi:drug/metabolite transporter (DMT)-like permease
MSDRPRAAEIPALIALFAGALAIGSAPIFVRVSETGPTATAFWRGCLALPVLALWAWLERRSPRAAPTSLHEPLFLWAGVFFAGDLALWHAAIMRTSIAASTLEANCAPVLVTVFAWLLWRERPRPAFLGALALAFAGMLLILLPKLGAGGGQSLFGDALGFGTACFYAAYLMAVASLRQRHGTAVVMFISTLIFTVLLLPLALLQKFWPDSAHGWWLLVGCALSAQALGQSLIAYAFAHLPATFAAIGLYVQVIAATVYAWLLLNERLTPLQMLGGLVVLVAIAIARRVHQSSAAPRATQARR